MKYRKDATQENAKIVLGTLTCIVFIIFGGISYLSAMYKAAPAEDVTVIAQIVIQVFGQNSVMFFVIKATTAILLRRAILKMRNVIIITVPYIINE